MCYLALLCCKVLYVSGAMLSRVFFFVFFCFVLNYTAFRCVRCLKSDERHVLAMLYLFSIFLRFLLQNLLFVSTDIYLYLNRHFYAFLRVKVAKVRSS